MFKDVTLPSGAKVRLTGISARATLDVLNKIPEPQVPTYVREGTSREEPNPMDPAYLKAVDKYRTDQGLLMNEAYLALGVTKVLEIPEGKHPLESDEWVEELEIVGIKIRREGMGRKVDWLQYHIIDVGDMADIFTGVAEAGGGVTEELVKQAADSFRIQQNGTTATRGESEAALRLGDQADSLEPSGSNGLRVVGSLQDEQQDLGTVAGDRPLGQGSEHSPSEDQQSDRG